MPTTVAAPAGSHWEYEEVRTAKKAESLGDQPLLVWDDLQAALAYYGEEGVKDILDGTSLRVSFQSISRRMAIAKKTADEIAKAQVDFRPGKRQGGASTPVSRAKRSAEKAIEKTGNADLVNSLLDKIASGAISADDLAALTS